jgi:hypothetical protein
MNVIRDVRNLWLPRGKKKEKKRKRKNFEREVKETPLVGD